MGTQQILLIVLSVIIVGVAIAVGISMFNNQAYNSNKTAIASDAQTFATQVVQFYKTPRSQGGGGGNLAAADTLGNFIGWQGITTDNENGTYTISRSGSTATITGVGKAVKGGKSPNISTVITMPEGTIVATASDI
jgi:hypothetical protein